MIRVYTYTCSVTSRYTRFGRKTTETVTGIENARDDNSDRFDAVKSRRSNAVAVRTACAKSFGQYAIVSRHAGRGVLLTTHAAERTEYYYLFVYLFIFFYYARHSGKKNKPRHYCVRAQILLLSLRTIFIVAVYAPNDLFFVWLIVFNILLLYYYDETRLRRDNNIRQSGINRVRRAVRVSTGCKR